ncbi:MAG: hypothetical protein QGH93_13680 [Gammaproteobacteria bacterium]|nr:hypothetical protein [Gammaproteobacteria bacterium]
MTLGVIAILAVAQIVFLYLLVHVDGYAIAGILGALNAVFIVLLSTCTGIDLDSRLTFSQNKPSLPVMTIQRNFLRVGRPGS